MNGMIAFFIAAFSALITIVNPFSTVPIFLSITTNNNAKQKETMARRASITAIIVLVVFAIAGSHILNFFGITLDAFRIAGGILITGIGWGMIHTGKKHFRSEKEHKEAIKKEDVSIIPLAIPSLSGPGAITTAIFLMQDAPTFTHQLLVIIAIGIVGLISYILLSKAFYLNKILNETTRHVIDKIMGLLVLVIGVQFIANGIIGLFGLA